MSEEQTAIEPAAKPLPHKLRPLLEVAHDIVRILESDQGEVTKALDDLELELETKVEAYAIAMRYLEAKRVALVSLAKHYAAQAAFRESDIDRLKNRLEIGMRTAGVEDIQTKTAHAWFRVDKAIEVDTKHFVARYRDDLEQGAVLLRQAEPEPNKTAIKKLLQAGAKIEFVTEVTRKSLQFR